MYSHSDTCNFCCVLHNLVPRVSRKMRDPGNEVACCTEDTCISYVVTFATVQIFFSILLCDSYL